MTFSLPHQHEIYEVLPLEAFLILSELDGTTGSNREWKVPRQIGKRRLSTV
ncbi:hypothetical protein SRABI118_01642 [Massilia sp. Bi118]|jgi:hypothetical protein|nr:hypothetical protein SRABI118_01642 [Massilia sp. Bi118]